MTNTLTLVEALFSDSFKCEDSVYFVSAINPCSLVNRGYGKMVAQQPKGKEPKMAQMFTRTINTYKATAYAIKWVDGKPEADELGSAEFIAAHESRTDARAALKAAGVDVKRGMEIVIECIDSTVWGMSVEEFMQHAQPVERGAKVSEK